MKACLEIELIGDSVRYINNLFRDIVNKEIPGLGTATFGNYPPSGWVAEISGFDHVYKYKREFLRFKKDYSRANRKGDRVFAEYILESGKIYDVKKNGKNRFFCIVTDEGLIKKLDESEVEEWLRNQSELTCLQQPETE